MNSPKDEIVLTLRREEAKSLYFTLMAKASDDIRLGSRKDIHILRAVLKRYLDKPAPVRGQVTVIEKEPHGEYPPLQCDE